LSAISPPTYANRIGVKSDTVRYWITTGQLDAVDFSKNSGGRPRWKIFPEAIAEFEARRAAKPAAPKPARQKKYC
jgi:hypothetical protein